MCFASLMYFFVVAFLLPQHQQCFILLPQYQIFQEQLPRFDAIVTASGSGGTHAGLVAGMTALRCDIPILGISTRHPKAVQTEHIHALAQKTYQHALGTNDELSVDAVTVYDDYVGPGYSLPTHEMEEAVTLFARTEGILLDPVYSGKAASGFLDLVRKGHFPPGANVLFLHTGGAPTLYHYQPLAPEVSVATKVMPVGVDDSREEKKAD